MNLRGRVSHRRNPERPGRSGGVEPRGENDDFAWPHRDGLIWPHFSSVVVGLDVA
jgi:hypothetical protein